MAKMIEEHCKLVEQFGFVDAKKFENVKPVPELEQLPLKDDFFDDEIDLPSNIDKDEQVIQNYIFG